MTGFEPEYSGIRSDRAVNCAQPTALTLLNVFKMGQTRTIFCLFFGSFRNAKINLEKT